MNPGREINIVLINGNQMELMLISEALKRLRMVYKITPFSNIYKALEYFDTNLENMSHLIIVDSDTMHLSGEYFLAKLRKSEKLRNIPLWILTDNEGEEVFFSYLNLPAKSFIVKPEIFRKHSNKTGDSTRSSDFDYMERFN